MKVVHANRTYKPLLLGLVLFVSAAIFLAMSETPPVSAFDIPADEDGHVHEPVAPACTSFGTLLQGAELSGTDTNANPTYAYTTYPTVLSNGNTPDHKWVHDSDSDWLIWNMGVGVTTSAVNLYPSIDHLPIPQEALETTVYGGTLAQLQAGTGVAGNITTIFDQGFDAAWISDDYVSRWFIPGGPYQYIAVGHGGPEAMYSDGDAEIDAICIPDDRPPTVRNLTCGDTKFSSGPPQQITLALVLPPALSLNTGSAGEGSLDPNWRLTAPAGAQAAYGVTTLVGWQPPTPFVAPDSAWIHPGSSVGAVELPGPYAYETKFSLAADAQILEINIQYAADNDVTFTLNGPAPGNNPSVLGPSVSLVPLSGTFTITGTSPTNWNQFHNASYGTPANAPAPPPGIYTLTATDINNPTGPTGLLVEGVVSCVRAPCMAAAGYNINTGTGSANPALQALDPTWFVNSSGPNGPAHGTVPATVPNPDWTPALPGTTWVEPNGNGVYSDPNTSNPLLPEVYLYQTFFTVPVGRSAFQVAGLVGNGGLLKFAADDDVEWYVDQAVVGTPPLPVDQFGTGTYVNAWGAPLSTIHTENNPLPGTWRLTAKVTNDPGGTMLDDTNPSGLLVQGIVKCYPEADGPVGGVASLTVSASSSSFPSTPLAAVAAAALAMLAAGLWCGRRRWLR